MTFNLRPTDRSRWSPIINETIDASRFDGACKHRIEAERNSSWPVIRRRCIIIESGFSWRIRTLVKAESLPATISVTEHRCLNYAENRGFAVNQNGDGRLKENFRNDFWREYDRLLVATLVLPDEKRRFLLREKSTGTYIDFRCIFDKSFYIDRTWQRIFYTKLWLQSKNLNVAGTSLVS